MSYKLVRFLICLLAIISLMAVLVFPAAASTATVSGECACLYLPQIDAFLYQKNADRRHPMASTTKIMTALVILEECDPYEEVMVSSDAVGVEGSSIYLKCGERHTVENLLYALLLASANDAAAALAVHAAGSIDAFADLMNEKAASLSLADTHFTNPHGLYDEEHYTTAYDLARITAAAMEDPTFCRIVATKSKVITTEDGETTRTLQNHNKLLRAYEDCVGVKTGFTKLSGRCLVSAAERNGMRLVAVTLDAPDDWRDHATLLDYGFSLYEGYVLDAGREITFDVPVINGERESVTLSAKNSVSIVLPKGAQEPTLTVEINRFAVAPVRKGQVLGLARYTNGEGKTVALIPLLANEGVASIPQKENLLDKIKHLLNM